MMINLHTDSRGIGAMVARGSPKLLDECKAKAVGSSP